MLNYQRVYIYIYAIFLLYFHVMISPWFISPLLSAGGLLVGCSVCNSGTVAVSWMDTWRILVDLPGSIRYSLW